MKKKLFVLVVLAATTLLQADTYAAEQTAWEKGGPKWIYVNPTKKPPHHGVYDEKMKCLDCHSYDGIDDYTSATMAMKKSKKGTAPSKEIEESVLNTLKGKGDYREIYTLATSYENKPLATVIEFVIDPATFTFYAMSEKQTEKLFQMASNQNVSLAYMKQRENYDYFGSALGVQIVGKATVLQGTDPEFEKAARIYIPTLPMPAPNPTMPQPPSVDALIEMIKGGKIITKVVPERIVIMNRGFKEKGYHAVQILYPGEKK